jgi:hypothetical protein
MKEEKIAFNGIATLFSSNKKSDLSTFLREEKNVFFPVNRRVFFLSTLAALHQAQEKNNNRKNLQLVVVLSV